MNLFISILLAHCIGDFILQSDKSVVDKERRKIKSPMLYLHVAIHFILMMVIVRDLDYLPAIGIITGLHLIIDIWKLYVKNAQNARWTFIADQLMHIITIAVVVDYVDPFVNTILATIPSGEILLMILSIVLLTAVSSRTIKVLISKWKPEHEDNEDDSLSDAGNYIGMLERLFIFAFVITGNLSSVGFLLAAKSIFRFGDLTESKDRKLTEYILIGTLLSFGSAMIIASGYLYLSQ